MPAKPGIGDHPGYVASTAASRSVGSLALGYYAGGKLAYAGRVGTGWSADTAKSLYATLEELKSKKPAFQKPLPAGAEKDVTWVEPRLVCAVEYRDLTAGGLVRQATFKGLRDDKPPEEITLESAPARPAGASPTPAPRPAEPTEGRSSGAPGTGAAGFGRERFCLEVKLTHPERILWPEPGITKEGLAQFYTDIADWILPHIGGRVLSLLRCPSGTNEKCFFAKHPWAGLSRFPRGASMSGKASRVLAIDDLAGLLGLVQAGVVEIHPWGSRADRPENPDRVIFDLDPGEDLAWSAVIAAAREIREELRLLRLESFVKTSGGKGLHVVVPIEPVGTWAGLKSFRHGVCRDAGGPPPGPLRRHDGQASPARPHLHRLPAQRPRGDSGRRLLDPRPAAGLRVNAARLGRTVRGAALRPFHRVDNLRHRLGFLKDDPWPEFFRLRQRLPAAATG